MFRSYLAKIKIVKGGGRNTPKPTLFIREYMVASEAVTFQRARSIFLSTQALLYLQTLHIIALNNSKILLF